ncbi:MAG TPA: flagellar hook capping FlgD N-terminal domain-containing protein [Terriglobales bacterium]|nr:flagellar hook capping FlgD N-terminal domain-containing protein [Terriglobales bacterium]
MNVNAVNKSSSVQNATSTPKPSDTSSIFMQLLLTQLQNQDPMSPMDGNQLASQIVQLNLLDQVTQIQQLVSQMVTPSKSKS